MKEEQEKNYIKFATQFRIGTDESPIFIIRAHTRGRVAWNITDGNAKNFLGRDGMWHFNAADQDNCIFDSLHDAFEAGYKVIDTSHSLHELSNELYKKEIEDWKRGKK